MLGKLYKQSKITIQMMVMKIKINIGYNKEIK